MAGIGKSLKWVLAGLALAAVATAVPIVRIEQRCLVEPAKEASVRTPILPAADRRDEVNTYLTYPEWSIVHAYEDLAAVARRSSESDYDYFRAIRDYWTNLCFIGRLASSRGAISTEYKVMLYVIGVSFAAEMGVKGLWESTIGRATAWVRGDRKTPEDLFALKLADDYAAFLRQVPWYEFPFGTRLWQFWRDTSLTEGNPLRKIERRIALTLEWGAKTLYARLIAVGAATSPAPLRIKSVVADLDATDVEADSRIAVVRKLQDGASVIETDRYRTFTEVVRGLAARGRTLREIAGNANILVTIHAPEADMIAIPGAAVLLSVPIRAKPGWKRVALDVRVDRLTALIGELARAGLVLEHVYDY